MLEQKTENIFQTPQGTVLGRDLKMFRNLKTKKAKVPAKFGQDWLKGFREKW